MSKLKVFGVIPSRLKATRFPNKPLALIAGQTMISRVVANCKKAKKLTELFVATDSQEIAQELKKEQLLDPSDQKLLDPSDQQLLDPSDQQLLDPSDQKTPASFAEQGRESLALQVQIVMTDSALPSGTDRVFAAIKNLKPDIVINIQGDEPLIHPDVIDEIVSCFEAHPYLDMVTMGQEIYNLNELHSKNIVKAIYNHNQEALYFSRFPIPYSRTTESELEFPLKGCLKHVGIYGYRYDFLERLCQTKPVELELNESLEQLRALYLGARMKVLKTEHFFLGVDVPEDIQKVEMWLESSKK